MPIDLNKVQQQAPHLVSLAKDVGVSLDKRGLSNTKAAVIMVLDISGSTTDLYREGIIQAAADLGFVAALSFDDDGEVPLCMFADAAYDAGVLDLQNHDGYINKELGKHRMGMTSYSSAIAWARQTAGFGAGGGGHHGFLKHRRDSGGGQVKSASQPTYVLFVTDGEPSDNKSEIVREITEASYEPIFWQFVGVGPHNFQFLRKLDEMGGRLIDNANFFECNNPKQVDVDTMVGQLLGEFPSWMREARSKGLLVSS